MSDSVWPHGLQPVGLLCPRDSPGKNTGVAFHVLFQGIFLTQGLNPHVLYLQTLAGGFFFYHQHHLGSPTMRRHSSANQGWALNRQLICSYFVLDVPLWNVLNFLSKPAQSRVICYGSPNKDWRACIFLLWHPLRPSVRIHSGTLQHDSKRLSFNSLEMGLYLTHSVYVWEVFAHHNFHKSYYLKKSIPAK